MNMDVNYPRCSMKTALLGKSNPENYFIHSPEKRIDFVLAYEYPENEHSTNILIRNFFIGRKPVVILFQSMKSHAH